MTTRRLKRCSVLRLCLLSVVYGAFLGAGAAFYALKEISRELPPRLDKVTHYRAQRMSRVFARNGELIGAFFLQRRVPVPLSRIPTHVRDAFIAGEDRRFWRHSGFDPIGIARAAWTNWRHDDIRQGASTITQQVVRMLLLSNERTVVRKAKELILSVRVERELSKEQILEIYLNQVYLGHGAYGVQAAAEAYFGKDVEHLTPAEAALLAGLPKAPSRFSPYRNYKRARERQAYVLERMHEDGLIAKAEKETASHEPLALVAREQPLNNVAAPYFVEHVRKWATDVYGDRLVFAEGVDIHTTLDMKMQHAAEAAVRDGLDAVDRKLGFRGPIGHLDGPEREAFAEGPPRPFVAAAEATTYTGGALLPEEPYVGLVTEMGSGKRGVQIDLGPRTFRLDDEDQRRILRWKEVLDGKRRTRRRLDVGDLVPVQIVRDARKGDRLLLAQVPDVQSALVALEPKTGEIRAMMGGYDYGRSQFNRATQARRQAGSAIKPFVYATALQNGFDVLSIVHDAPIAIRTSSGLWSPSNYKNEYLGPLTLKTALAKSINTVSVRLVLAVGVDAVVKTMRTLGITTRIVRNMSLALGTPDVSLLEMTAAYASFPAGGVKVTPRFVTLVLTGGDQILEDHRQARLEEQAIPPGTAYLMVDLMKGVVERGTGRKAQELGRPAGGKTGTSTGHRDAWFIAFTADLACGVWVGRDNFTPIGFDATGGATALPIWLQFMRAAHPDTPVRDFQPPPDVMFVRASETSGEPAAPGAPGAAWVPFTRGTIPPRFTSHVDSSRFSNTQGFGDLRP